MIDAANMIRKLRIERNMTQASLAKLMNTTKQCISYYESGKRKVGLETLEAFADVFNVPITMFVSENVLNEEYRKEYAKPEYRDAISSAPQPSELSADEQHLLAMFRAMNADGQRMAMTTMESFAMNPAFQKESTVKPAM